MYIAIGHERNWQVTMEFLNEGKVKQGRKKEDGERIRKSESKKIYIYVIMEKKA